MRIAINKVHFPVTTLGFGRRVGLWMQGCSIRCPGCLSRDTWEERPETFIEMEVLVGGINAWLREADGVTISGGEPFDQPQALACLIEQIRAVHAGDILVYSGYSLERIASEFPDVVEMTDVLISDPFVAGAAQTRVWRGSGNQRITLLSPLARDRYASDINERPWPPDRRLDLMIDENEMWMAGIPKPGDLEKLRDKLALAGYSSQSSQEAGPFIRA
jgi:anaerobic ribonucleoside-triphosphate reductase activating protein